MGDRPLTFISTCIVSSDIDEGKNKEQFQHAQSIIKKYKPLMVYFISTTNDQMYVNRIINMGYNVNFTKDSSYNNNMYIGKNGKSMNITGKSDEDISINIHFSKDEFKKFEKDILNVPDSHNILIYAPSCGLKIYTILLDIYWPFIINGQFALIGQDMKLMICEGKSKDKDSKLWNNIEKYLKYEPAILTTYFKSTWKSRNKNFNLYYQNAPKPNIDKLTLEARKKIIETDENKAISLDDIYSFYGI